MGSPWWKYVEIIWKIWEFSDPNHDDIHGDMMIGDDLDLKMVYIRWNVAIESGKSWLIIDFWDTLCLDKPYIRYIYMTISSDIVWKILLRQQHVWFSQELSTTCIFWGWFTHDAHGLRVASLGLSKHWNTRTFCTWPSKPLFHSKHLPRNPLVCPHSNNTSKQ